MEPPAFPALVAAYEPGPGPGGLRALVPLAGRPLVEHQLRRALAAGADRLLLLVDQVPVELAQVVTALRREGVAVEAVAGLDLAADALAPDQVVLVLADACLPEEAALRRVAAHGPPCLLSVADRPERARYERIDADTRWGGVALLDGARVASAAAMLGSWDPVSTLLRRAVQEGARRVDAGADLPIMLVDAGEVAETEAGIVRAAWARPQRLVDRFVHAPLLALAVPRLLARGTAPEALAWPGGLLALAGGAMALAGLRWPALLALIAAAPLREAGRQLARIADRPLGGARLLDRVAAAGAVLAVLGLAWQLASGSGQWGWWLVAAATLAGAGLLALLRPLLAPPLPTWLAEGAQPFWLLLPFAPFGRWDLGLAAVALHALASGGWAGRQVVRGFAADRGLAPPKLF